MTNTEHTYTATYRDGKTFTGTAREVTRTCGSEVWNYYGEAVDHDTYCVCRQPISLPADPFGTPEKIVSAF